MQQNNYDLQVQFEVSTLQPKILSNEDQPIEYIWHLSDLHIHNDIERVDEFKGVFTNLIDSMCRDLIKISSSNNNINLKIAVQKAKDIIQNDLIINEPIEMFSCNTLMVICGDLLNSHGTYDECAIRLFRHFLKSMTCLTRVILITGNHDYKLNTNVVREAISELADLPNVFLCLQTNHYVFSNLVFSVYSLYDKKLLNMKDPVCKNRTIIALFHGNISAYEKREDTSLDYSNLDLKTFETADFGMYGDAHNFKYLDKSKRHAYSSNLVKLHVNESSSKGYILWNLKTGNSEFINVKNRYSRTRAIFDDNKMIQEPELSEENIINLRYTNSDKDKCITLLKEYVKLQKKNIVSIIPEVDQNANNDQVNYELNINNNEQIIRKYNEIYTKKDDTFMNKIINIHNELSKTIQIEQNITPNKPYKILRLFFSNVFSYGLNNYIDFTTLKHRIGIVGKNGHGKSSLLKVLLLSLASHKKHENPKKYINTDSNGEMETQVDVESEGIIYRILRSFKTTYDNEEQDDKKIKTKQKKKENSYVKKVTKLFIVNSETGETILYDENSENISTEQKIGSIIGNPEYLESVHFIMQKGKIDSFLNLESGHDTFNYFTKFFQGTFEMFDNLEKLSTNKINTLEGEMKVYKGFIDEYDNTIDKSQQKEYNKLVNDYDNNKDTLTTLTNRISELQEELTTKYLEETYQDLALKTVKEINVLITQHKNIIQSNNTELENLKNIKSNKQNVLTEIDIITEQNTQVLTATLNNLKLYLGQQNNSEQSGEKKIGTANNICVLEKNIQIVEKKINTLKIRLNETNNESMTKYLLQMNQALNNINNLVTNIKNKKTSQEIVDSIDFENYSINLSNTLNEDIKKEQIKLDNYINKLNKLKKSLPNNNDLLINIKTIDKLLAENNNLNIKKNTIITELLVLNEKRSDLILNNQIISNEIDKLIILSHNISKNIKIQKELERLKKQKQTLEEKSNVDKNKIKDMNYGKLNSNNYELNLQKYQQLQQELELYKYYKNIVSKNEIQTMILKNILNKMNIIINDILKIFTSLQVKFYIEPGSTKTTRTQDIYPTIKLFTDDKRPLDMLDGAGSQQFLINLAIRTGIKKILSLGGPDTFVIDEGVSVLDPENINLLADLFTYIQTEYNHSLIVSHVPAVAEYYQDRLIVKQKVINKGTSYISNLENIPIPDNMISCSELQPSNRDKKNKKINKKPYNMPKTNQQSKRTIATKKIDNSFDTTQNINDTISSNGTNEKTEKISAKRGRKPTNCPSFETSLNDEKVQSVLKKDDNFSKFKKTINK